MPSHAVGLADVRLTDPGPSRRPVAPMPTAPPSVSRPAPGVLRDEAQAGTETRPAARQSRYARPTLIRCSSRPRKMRMRR
jgi:hypothetical protein